MEISLVSARLELKPRRVTRSGFLNRFVAPCYKRSTRSGFEGIAASILSITRFRAVVDTRLQRPDALLTKVRH